MLPVRMETEDRYYVMHFTHDMLGDPVLVCDHDGKLTGHHRRLIKVVGSENEAELMAEAIVKTRYQRGYDIITEGGLAGCRA